MSFDTRRDYYAGGLMAMIGAGAAYEGSSYGIGTLRQMQAGMFPVLIGVGLVLVGAAIAATASSDSGAATTGLEGAGHAAPTRMDWRGWCAIISGVGLFIVFCQYLGLLPAIFTCVFVSALGSRVTTWKEAMALAAGVTVFGIALFSYGLQVQIPIIQGMQ